MHPTTLTRKTLCTPPKHRDNGLGLPPLRLPLPHAFTRPLAYDRDVNPDATSGVPAIVPGSRSVPGPGAAPGSRADAGVQVQTYQTHAFAPVVTGTAVKKSKLVSDRTGTKEQDNRELRWERGWGVLLVVSFFYYPHRN
jgi:hypothetical protein